MSNDLTFFTNEPGQTLLDRFTSTLPTARYLDVLVGYFRTSGFHLLHDALRDVEKIRILVGLSVDRQAFEIIDTYQNNTQIAFDFLTAKQAKDSFADHVADEMARSDDSRRRDWEAALNRLVYRLYDLTTAEIQLIENSLRE